MTDLQQSGRPPAMSPGLWLNFLSELGTAMLVHAQWDGGMPYQREAVVPGTVADPVALLPDGAEVRLDQRTDGDRRVVGAWPGLVVEIEVRHRVTAVTAVGRELAAVEGLVERVAAAARRVTAVPDGSVRMCFWSYGDDAGERSTRRVETPAWDDVAGNYAARTAAGLDRLMRLTGVESRGGRLLLWHGRPGTGKTTAARALSRAWAGWCQPHYVMDPERLFAEPRYLLQLAGADDDPADERWRLIVAEDCDEYLRADAKLRAGASLGRLLNLCDGILGHGLRVLLLLTTNEDVGRLHPAITRPGRLLSEVEFEPLSPAEARAWLGSGRSAPEAPLTLAELYALAEDRSTGPRPEPDVGGYL